MCFNERIIFNRFHTIATWSGIEGARDIWRPTNYITVREKFILVRLPLFCLLGFSLLISRVQSRIYRLLGETSWVAKGHKLPRVVQGLTPRKFFEMIMRWHTIWCVLRQLWEMLQWYFISFFQTWSRSDNVTILNVPCHIVSLEREYLHHGHWPRRVWIIFPI